MGEVGPANATPERPDDLPVDAQAFWRASEELADLETAPLGDEPSALERLGSMPLPAGGFPLMGFFATVYEHIAEPLRDE